MIAQRQARADTSDNQASIDDYMDITEYDYGGPEQPYVGEVSNDGDQNNEEANIYEERMDEDVDRMTRFQLPGAAEEENNDNDYATDENYESDEEENDDDDQEESFETGQHVDEFYRDVEGNYVDPWTLEIPPCTTVPIEYIEYGQAPLDPHKEISFEIYSWIQEHNVSRAGHEDLIKLLNKQIKSEEGFGT